MACVALYRTSSPYLIGLIGASAFVMAPAANTAVYGRLAATVPDRLAAGVNASLTQVVNLLAPFAPIVAGAAMDMAGPGNTVLLCGAFFGALTVTVFAVPSLRTSAVKRA